LWHMRLAAWRPPRPSANRTSAQSNRAQKRNRCRGHRPSHGYPEASQLANSFASIANPSTTVERRTPCDAAAGDGSLHVCAITTLYRRYYGLANGGRIVWLPTSPDATLPADDTNSIQDGTTERFETSNAKYL